MMISGRNVVWCLVAFAVCCVERSPASEKEFDFKDPKGVNTISFVLDSAIEPIMGVAQGISGKVKFDPADPKSLSGSISVKASEIHCANAGMTRVLHSEDWLDVKKYANVEFTFKQVREVESASDGVFKMTVVGDFTCRGVTKEITVEVQATYLPKMMAKRMRGKEGDLLVLRSRFVIHRSDFGIKPEYGPQSVAEDIELRISLVGGAPKK